MSDAPDIEAEEPDEVKVIFPFACSMEPGMGSDYDPTQPYHALLVLDLHVLEQTDDEPPRHVLYRIPFPAEQAIALAEMITENAKEAVGGTNLFNKRN